MLKNEINKRDAALEKFSARLSHIEGNWERLLCENDKLHDILDIRDKKDVLEVKCKETSPLKTNTDVTNRALKDVNAARELFLLNKHKFGQDLDSE